MPAPGKFLTLAIRDIIKEATKSKFLDEKRVRLSSESQNHRTGEQSSDPQDPSMHQLGALAYQ